MNQKIPIEMQQLPPQFQENLPAIKITNLDSGISNDYLYRKFKQAGEIIKLKIIIDQSTKKSKGFAFITYKDQQSADTAIQMFNKQKLIKNVINVFYKLSDVYPSPPEKNGKIFVSQLPQDVDEIELEQEFSRFGEVFRVEILKDENKQSMNQCFVHFWLASNAEKLVERHQKIPTTVKGTQVVVEIYKKKDDNIVEEVIMSEFASALSNDPNVRMVLPYIFEPIVKELLLGFEINFFVKMSKGYPVAQIQFSTKEETQKQLEKLMTLKEFPCIDALRGLQIIKKHASINYASEIADHCQKLAEGSNDIFKQLSEQFFLNLIQEIRNEKKQQLQ